MSTMRIDIRKDSYGSYQLYGQVPGRDDPRWNVTIKDHVGITVISYSNANPNKNTLSERNKVYPFKEGSLFLVNHANDWYSYFREKTRQDFYDKYHIVKVIDVNSEETTLTLPFINGINQNPIIYMDGWEMINAQLNPTSITSEDKKLSTVELTLKKKGGKGPCYFIQVSKDRNNCHLDIHRSTEISSLYSVDLKAFPEELEKQINEIANR